ncbi:hypothetical protein L1987_58611 [Smallanthus sonchifolius]|uniref:Uncharacterized protein n=1 Tax=Smallanthus sonchifolius TaxID=185202 RepID=A0ACB9DGT1_9ASTR|nr:hypothetical protein L1987_58611 [Smallanthus sonchifolius]
MKASLSLSKHTSSYFSKNPDLIVSLFIEPAEHERRFTDLALSALIITDLAVLALIIRSSSVNSASYGSDSNAVVDNWKPISGSGAVDVIVPDVQDVYTPLQTDVIVQLSKCRQHLDLLLESIPTMFQNNKTTDSTFGVGIQPAVWDGF